MFKPDRHFDDDGTSFGFLRETGPGPRCTSLAVPHTAQPLLLAYMKTTAGLADPEFLKILGGCGARDELHAQTTPDAARPWCDVEWDKPEKRGIIFLLHGVRDQTLQHIWPCADKPLRCADGQLFREANVHGFQWTLPQLANDTDAVTSRVVLHGYMTMATCS